MSEAKCYICGKMYEEEEGQEGLYPKKCGNKDCSVKESQPIKKEKPKNVQAVKVIDFDMEFGSMVTFMVKWAIASIPAMIILFIIGMVFLMLVGGSVTSLISI